MLSRTRRIFEALESKKCTNNTLAAPPDASRSDTALTDLSTYLPADSCSESDTTLTNIKIHQEFNNLSEALNYDVLFEGCNDEIGGIHSGNLHDASFEETENELLEISNQLFTSHTDDKKEANYENITVGGMDTTSGSDDNTGCDPDEPEFLPEEDDERSSDDEEAVGDENVEAMEVNKIIPRLVKQKTKKEKRIALRNLGSEYVNTRGNLVPGKEILANPCKGKDLCRNKCNTFSDEERTEIFNFFWALGDNNKQKQFLSECVSVNSIKRRRKSKGEVNRKVTNQYTLIKGNNRLLVCQQFLLKTLNISQRMIRSVIENKDLKKFGSPDLRGKSKPHNKASNEQINHLKMFIESLPAVPSHYCRGSTNKKYLPSDVKSFNNLYKKYVESDLKNTGFSPLKRSCFLEKVKSLYNIGIHRPRKDKCIKCERFSNLGSNKMDSDINEYKIHILEKEAAKKLFMEEQSISAKDDKLVVSFDLQKVLATPHGDSMLIGFSRKYAVFNFTTYESGTRRGTCYLWGEKDGKRGPNEIATNLFTFLNKIDMEKRYHTISLYCDNCSGQNKNKYVLAMLRYFLDQSNFINQIKLTFLIVGHTYLPADSMHAIIENYTKGIIVQAPSEWPTILRNARTIPEPYEVVQMSFNDFLDFKSLCLEKTSQIKISEIKSVTILKNDELANFSTSFLENETKHILLKLKNKSQVAMSCYKEQLSINRNKYNDLKSLCHSFAIKSHYHAEYLTLKTSHKIPDTLDETDEEDVDNVGN